MFSTHSRVTQLVEPSGSSARVLSLASRAVVMAEMAGTSPQPQGSESEDA